MTAAPTNLLSTEVFSIGDALRYLQSHIGRANAAKGFHEEGEQIRRFPLAIAGAHIPAIVAKIINPLLKLFPSIERNYNAARLALITTEVSEAIEEIRAGRGVNETYYSGGVVPTRGLPEDDFLDYHGDPRKPEGVPSEVADVVIRAFDFADENGIDLAAIIEEKLAYNATRAHKHGKKF